MKQATKKVALQPREFLSGGVYLALRSAEVKTLRAAKGDRARRAHVESLVGSAKKWLVDTKCGWSFLQFVLFHDHAGGTALFQGKKLHRGDLRRLNLLDSAALPELVELMNGVDDTGFRKQFFASSDTDFRYGSVPFWVNDDWKRIGRTTAFTEGSFRVTWKALKALRTFLPRALADDRTLLFTVDFTKNTLGRPFAPDA
ncbi:hypothetical protein OAX78_02255 [Planctomycetota bacterium]|nr:hypothetical protein [Planctomycetota bacterium]